MTAHDQYILEADNAPIREALNSVRWERRGWLGRLVRSERAPVEAEVRARHDERLAA